MFKAVALFFALVVAGLIGEQALMSLFGWSGDDYAGLRFLLGMVIGFVASQVALTYYLNLTKTRDE